MAFNLFRVETAHLFRYAVTSRKLRDVTEVKALHFSNRGTTGAVSQNNEIKIWKKNIKVSMDVILLRVLSNYTSRLSAAMTVPKY